MGMGAKNLEWYSGTKKRRARNVIRLCTGFKCGKIGGKRRDVVKMLIRRIEVLTNSNINL